MGDITMLGECLLLAESSRWLTSVNGDFGPEPAVRVIYFEAEAKVSNRPKADIGTESKSPSVNDRFGEKSGRSRHRRVRSLYEPLGGVLDEAIHVSSLGVRTRCPAFV